MICLPLSYYGNIQLSTAQIRQGVTKQHDADAKWQFQSKAKCEYQNWWQHHSQQLHDTWRFVAPSRLDSGISVFKYMLWEASCWNIIQVSKLRELGLSYVLVSIAWRINLETGIVGCRIKVVVVSRLSNTFCLQNLDLIKFSIIKM